MKTRTWTQEFAEAAHSAWAAARALWIQDVWPLFLTIGIFLLMAAPLVIVILILWYLDSIGWRANRGFYTIGSAVHHQVQVLMG